LSFGECFKLNFMFIRSGELVNYISSMPSSAEVVRAMDEISNTVISSLVAFLHPCYVVHVISYWNDCGVFI